jgi:hypothetical protein
MKQKFSIVFAFVVGSIVILLSLNQVYGQSDFYLEAKVNPDPLDPLEITKFEIQGEIYKEICPSGQCKIDYTDKSNFFFLPSTSVMSISPRVEFTVQDNITNADLGPKEKQFMEQFNAWTSCGIDDIVEENGQEIYTCHDGFTTITRKFDSKSWDFNIIGVYDAKNNILKISGNFTGMGN